MYHEKQTPVAGKTHFTRPSSFAVICLPVKTGKESRSIQKREESLEMEALESKLSCRFMWEGTLAPHSCPHRGLCMTLPSIFGWSKWYGYYKRRLSFMLLEQIGVCDIRFSGTFYSLINQTWDISLKVFQISSRIILNFVTAPISIILKSLSLGDNKASENKYRLQYSFPTRFLYIFIHCHLPFFY